MKIICFVPVRKGSKGILGKSIRVLGGGFLYAGSLIQPYSLMLRMKYVWPQIVTK